MAAPRSDTEIETVGGRGRLSRHCAAGARKSRQLQKLTVGMNSIATNLSPSAAAETDGPVAIRYELDGFSRAAPLAIGAGSSLFRTCPLKFAFSLFAFVRRYCARGSLRTPMRLRETSWTI